MATTTSPVGGVVSSTERCGIGEPPPTRRIRENRSPKALRRGPRYAFFYNGQWRVNPPITHPPFCVCTRCKTRRDAGTWDRPITIRLDRVSPYETESESIAYASELRRAEEELLTENARRAREEGLAVGTDVSFGELCEAYRAYQRRNGCRLDRDQFRIDRLEDFFGANRAARALGRRDAERFRQWLVTERRVSSSTVQRHLATLLAILNSGVKEGLLDSHALAGLRREPSRRTGRPVTFNPAQLSVLTGMALDVFEQEQQSLREEGRPHSRVPLRGFVLVGLRTLLRPTNNFGLKWEQLVIGPAATAGRFHIEAHKNARRGLVLEGPLAASLVRYLVTIRPSSEARGLVHPNPSTGLPYRSIRRAWRRLIQIANGILALADQIDPKVRFYTLRATGASELVAAGADPILVTRFMGNNSLLTVDRHYFNSSFARMEAAVRRWDPAAAEEGQ